MQIAKVSLGQSNSAVNAGWIPKSADSNAVADIAKHLGCPPAIAQTLVARSIDTAAVAEAFLNPSLAALLDDPANDPAHLLGVGCAIDRILAAILAAEPILIYGDYDVDGTTATVLLKTAIERVALAIDPAKPASVTFHVPHRIREGYGMKNAILAEAAASGVRLVISVDTGIRAVSEAAEARALAMDLIVTDHHLPDSAAELPDAFAVVNPAQPGCPYPNKNLCGAAVAFKLAQALLAAAATLTPDPDAFRARTRRVLVPSFLKLVAIATVADSVPLTGENRVITAVGLAELANPVQPGLRALMQVAKIPTSRAPTTTEVGFRLAPRINAAGRMDIADDVVELFLTRDADRAIKLAEKLDRLNQERRDSEAHALDAIDDQLLALVDADGNYPRECMILDHPDWHRGVLGILASRVVERTGRPALVLTHADGDAHGSGRSVPGFHLLDAIAWSNNVDPAASLFHRFGGHAHAVGLSLARDRIDLLRARMRQYTTTHLTTDLLTPQLDYDAEIDFAQITSDLYAWIKRLAPFGVDNPEPVLLTRNAVLAAPIRFIQARHIGLQLLQCGASAASDMPAIPALGWSRDALGWAERCRRHALNKGSVVDVLYRLRHNTGPYARSQFGGLELDLVGLRPVHVECGGNQSNSEDFVQ